MPMAESGLTKSVPTARRGIPNLPPLRKTGALQNLRATVLFYSTARWGKTHLIQTLKNPIIIATELGRTKGLNTLRNANLPFVAVDHEDQMTAVLAEMKKTPEGVFYGGEGPFDWVVLDSLSNLGWLWYEASLQARGWEMAWDGASGKDPRMAYPYIGERGRQQFARLLDLDAHIFAIAREQTIEEGEGRSKIMYYAPELPGQQLNRSLPGWPDATLHGVWHNGIRKIRTRPLGKTVAGIRSPYPVPELIRPDIDAVKDLLLGDESALQRLAFPQPEKATALPALKKP